MNVEPSPLIVCFFGCKGKLARKAWQRFVRLLRRNPEMMGVPIRRPKFTPRSKAEDAKNVVIIIQPNHLTAMRAAELFEKEKKRRHWHLDVNWTTGNAFAT